LLAQDWQVPENRLWPVIDGVDTDRFRPFPRREARRRFGIPEDVPLVVFLGILNAYQGIDLLLTAMTILKSRKSLVRFLVMGFPEDGYRRKAHKLGLDGMVTFTGRIDYSEAPALLCAGDLAISPKLSLTEANGKLFNYMACGLPTLVFETPVNREILGDSGEYAIYGDAADLATRITELLDDRERLDRRSCELREKAVDEHSWKARAVRIERLYRQLLGS
jgi:glycosyltransferase involved in cell wall biosynthesis